MGRDLAPGRKPDIVAGAGLGGDCLERPGACGPPIDMGMGGDVEHHGFARASARAPRRTAPHIARAIGRTAWRAAGH
jgi:hypothetical protein